MPTFTPERIKKSKDRELTRREFSELLFGLFGAATLAPLLPGSEASQDNYRELAEELLEKYNASSADNIALTTTLEHEREMGKRVAAMLDGERNRTPIQTKEEGGKKVRMREVIQENVTVIEIGLDGDIQAAIDSIEEAAYGETEITTILRLEPGTYSLTDPFDISNRPLRIESAGPGQAILDCNNQCTAFKIDNSAVSSQWTKARVEMVGLDIIDGYRESYGGNGAGIEYCRQTDLALENCNFDHCVGPLSGAIHASDYSHLHFNGVRVTNCEADEGTGGGISAYQCAVVSLKDVEIEGCESWNVGGGIEICTIGLPTEWLDIELDDVRITNCDVQREGAVGAGLSISYVYEDTTVLKNVVLADNLGAFGETHDLGLYRAYITANEACGLGHVDCFAEASVTINQAPTAETDSATATENEPIAIPVLENDHDLEGDVISLVSATNPLHGQVEINTETGMVTYTPDSGYTGSDHFSYTISDDLDNFATGSVTVMVEEGQKFIYLPLVTNQFR